MLIWVILNTLLVTAFASNPCTPITPFPPGHVCSVRGYYYYEYNGNPYATNQPLNHTTQSLEDCVNIAFSDLLVHGIGYNAITKTCTFIPLSFGTDYSDGMHFIRNRTSDTYFYDKSCFTCPLTCPPPLDGSNFIYNGDITIPLDRFNFTGFNRFPVVSPGYNSKFALEIPLELNLEDISADVDRNFRICNEPSQQYLFSFDYKYDNLSARLPPGGAKMYWEVSNLMGEFDFVNQPQVGEWHKLTYTTTGYFYKSKNNDTTDFMDIGCQYYSDPENDRFFLDNMKVEAIGGQDFPPATQGPNLLTNGDFETGYIFPWKVYRHGHIVPGSFLYGPNAPAGSNKYALHASRTTQLWQLSQDFTGLQPYAQYLFSFDYRLLYLHDIRDPLHVTVSVSQGEVNSVENSIGGILTHNTTTTYSWSLTPLWSNATVTIQASHFRGLTIDNIAIRQLA